MLAEWTALGAGAILPREPQDAMVLRGMVLAVLCLTGASTPVVMKRVVKRLRRQTTEVRHE